MIKQYYLPSIITLTLSLSGCNNQSFETQRYEMTGKVTVIRKVHAVNGQPAILLILHNSQAGIFQIKEPLIHVQQGNHIFLTIEANINQSTPLRVTTLIQSPDKLEVRRP